MNRPAGWVNRLIPLPTSDAPRVGWRQWWWLPVAWCSGLVLFSLQPWVAGWMPFEDAFVRFGLARVAPWILSAPLVVWLSVRLPIAGRRWPGALLVHALAAALLLSAMAWSEQQFMPRPPMRERSDWRAPDATAGEPAGLPPRPGFSGRSPRGRAEPPAGPRGGRAPWLMLSGRQMPFYLALVAAAHVLHFQLSARRAAALEAALVAARLSTLQTQLQPHFLFNALNAISALVHLRPAIADEMICALGALLHGVLDTTHRAEVTIEEELRLAEHYLKIQSIRFGSALSIEREIDPATLGALVPTLALQPLLENAVKHGLRGQPGRIRIASRREAERVIIEVRDFSSVDNRSAAPSQPGVGFGLANIRERLATLHGPRAVLRFTPGPAGATVTIELPFRPSGGAA